MELLIAIISSVTALLVVWLQHFLVKKREEAIKKKVAPIIEHNNTRRFSIIIKHFKEFKFKSKSAEESKNSLIFENKDLVTELEFDNLDLVSKEDRESLREYSEMITRKIG